MADDRTYRLSATIEVRAQSAEQAHEIAAAELRELKGGPIAEIHLARQAELFSSEPFKQIPGQLSADQILSELEGLADRDNERDA